MKETQSLNGLFTGLDKDFKAEVTAAELVEEGFDAERILILMLGALKRPFSKDVESVDEEISEYDHKEYTLIKTPREGIYDILPEGLFHSPTMHNSGKTEKEIIKMMKLRREEEQQARKFFLPFEATINFLRMQMALHENRLDKRSHYHDLVDIFASEWEIFQYLDARQANIFLHLIPVMHDMRDDHAAIETIMEMMLLQPVHISLRSQLPTIPTEPILSRLGEHQLGVDFTTGNMFYYEGVQEIILEIGPMKKETLKAFMPGGVKGKILTLLSDYLLPVDMDVITEFQLDEKDRTTRLDDKVNDYNSVLGADTYL
jgi:type VI secretion system protein ImpH